MKTIAAVLALTTTAILGQDLAKSDQGPVYDASGRMIAYHYPDKTQESYAYDNAGRMIRFTDRSGGVTTFKYLSDGSMVTTAPDGTTRH